MRTSASQSCWQTNGYGSTLQYGDIDGDGLVDVCGRGAEGIICMTQLVKDATGLVCAAGF